MPKISDRMVTALSDRIKKMTDGKATASECAAIIRKKTALTLKLLTTFSALPESEVPHRIVEFGCGDNMVMILIAHAIADLYKKNLFYVAIDINTKYIASTKAHLPAKLNASTHLIAADASNLNWFKDLKEQKSFDTAIFNSPITEDPYDVWNEHNQHQGVAFGERLERFRRATELRKQYLAFKKIFNHIVPAVMTPTGSILISTFYREEYTAAIRMLQAVTDMLPSTHDPIPPHSCLITRLNPDFTLRAMIESGFGSGSKAVAMPINPNSMWFKRDEKEAPLNEMEKLGFGRGSSAAQYRMK